MLTEWSITVVLVFSFFTEWSKTVLVCVCVFLCFFVVVVVLFLFFLFVCFFFFVFFLFFFFSVLKGLRRGFWCCLFFTYRPKTVVLVLFVQY